MIPSFPSSSSSSLSHSLLTLDLYLYLYLPATASDLSTITLQLVLDPYYNYITLLVLEASLCTLTLAETRVTPAVPASYLSLSIFLPISVIYLSIPPSELNLYFFSLYSLSHYPLIFVDLTYEQLVPVPGVISILLVRP